MDPRLIKEKIKFYRQKNSLTQHSMASLMGITQSFYQKIESGDSGIQLTDFIKICEIFKISMDELIFGDNKLTQDHLHKNQTAKFIPVRPQTGTDHSALLQMYQYIKEQETILKALMANCNVQDNNGKRNP